MTGALKDRREEWFDAERRVAVTFVDVTSAAQQLASGHLCGPTSAYFLSKAVATAALLGAEMSEKDETLSIQMKCSGPLGGFNVECTAEGTLRGYTEKKLLDEFDGMGRLDARKVVGERRIQVTRSVRDAHRHIAVEFPVSTVYQCHIPSYPSGHWLFGFASKKYHPIGDLDEARWNKLGIATRYYNTDLHRGAFALPNYVRDLLRVD